MTFMKNKAKPVYHLENDTQIFRAFVAISRLIFVLIVLYIFVEAIKCLQQFEIKQTNQTTSKK